MPCLMILKTLPAYGHLSLFDPTAVRIGKQVKRCVHVYEATRVLYP